jgi:hypothetical protein
MSIFENVQGLNSFQKSGAGEMGDSITSGGEMFQFGGRLPDGQFVSYDTGYALLIGL